MCDYIFYDVKFLGVVFYIFCFFLVVVNLDLEFFFCDIGICEVSCIFGLFDIWWCCVLFVRGVCFFKFVFNIFCCCMMFNSGECFVKFLFGLLGLFFGFGIWIFFVLCNVLNVFRVYGRVVIIKGVYVNIFIFIVKLIFILLLLMGEFKIIMVFSVVRIIRFDLFIYWFCVVLFVVLFWFFILLLCVFFL